MGCTKNIGVSNVTSDYLKFLGTSLSILNLNILPSEFFLKYKSEYPILEQIVQNFKELESLFEHKVFASKIVQFHIRWSDFT
jgi:hypothetical protein